MLWRSSVESAVGRTIGEMARERSPHSILEAVYESSWEVVFDLLVEDPDTTCADFIDKREYEVERARDDAERQANRGASAPAPYPPE